MNSRDPPEITCQFKMILNAMGSNAHGQCVSGKDDSHVPVPNEFDLEIIDLDGGSNHTVFITKESVYSVGDNSRGQLGHSHPGLTRLEFELACKFVVCGWEHTFVGLETGLLVFGDNQHGQLGLDTSISHAVVPTRLDITVVKVATSVRHSLFLFPNGTVHGCGSNKFNQLGLESQGDLPLTRIESLAHIIDIGCGFQTSFALSKSGIVYIMGRNKHGELAVSPSVKSSILTSVDLSHISPTFLACGWFSVIVQGSKGAVGWGRHDHGQLSIPIPSSSTSNDICVWCPTLIPLNCTSIKFGSEHAIALMNDNAYVWGWNEHGNCGLDHTNDVLTPTLVDKNVFKVASGSGHTLYLKS